MSKGWLTEDAQRFVVENIRSIGQLEALFLLASQPGRSWKADEVGEELRSGGNAATHWLFELRDAKVICSDGVDPPSFRFAPEDTQKIQIVQELMAAFRSYRMRVIDLVYASDGSSVRSLANAFRWRK